MTPIAPALSESVFALTLALLFLTPLAIAGVALINTGLGRSRSAAQSLLALGHSRCLRHRLCPHRRYLHRRARRCGHVFQLAANPGIGSARDRCF